MSSPLRAISSGAGFKVIALIVLGTLTLSGMHALVRFVSTDIDPFEIAFFRNFFGFLIFVPWLARNGIRVLKTDRIGLHLLRGSINACSMSCWFWGLSMTPLAQATALISTMPIFVALGASIYLGEKVGVGRWGAVILGLVGTLVIVGPGGATIDLGFALIMGSCLFATASRIFAKELSDSDGASTIVAWVTIVMTPITLIPALFVWTWPDWHSLIWLVALGVLGTTSHVCIIQSYKWLDVSLVEPFLFLRLLWAAVIGFFLFREIPTMNTWIGGAVIGVAIVSLALYEYSKRARGRARAQADALPAE
jgi:drug/metabolite transporter (DMT)-like permease